MYIDIHNHYLYEVDDGAKSFGEAKEMLLEAHNQGAAALILTPHYRHGMFAYPLEAIQDHFARLRELSGEIGVQLYLGCEYHVDSQIVSAFYEGRCHSLADGDYILTEYSYRTEYAYIAQYTQQIVSHGYIPVIAHVERYQCLLKKPDLCVELSDMGAMIQINADAVLGLNGRAVEHFCKKLLKREWADIIASDAHGMTNRACHMRQCLEHIRKKYGEGYARELFWGNPKKILIDTDFGLD